MGMWLLQDLVDAIMGYVIKHKEILDQAASYVSIGFPFIMRAIYSFPVR